MTSMTWTCRDIYAKANEATAETSTATGVAAAAYPFTSIKDDFFYIGEGNTNCQKQKPFQPHVTPQGRGKKKEEVAREEVNRGTPNQGRMTFTRDSQIEEASSLEIRGGRGGYDRSQNQRKPRVASKTSNQDRCYNCNEPGHFSRECPQRNNGNMNSRPQQQKLFLG